jgi:diguanylate cyclase (GGDEF)-like protein
MPTTELELRRGGHASKQMGADQKENEKMLDRLAAENGVAIVVLDAAGAPVAEANNNSLCRSLYPSKDFGPRCAEFCGKAFQVAHSTGEPFEYQCYAGLNCRAVPVIEGDRRYVAVIGRTFLTADKYRKATERAISGDWSIYSPAEFFENVLMSSSTDPLDRVEESLSKFRPSPSDDLLDLPAIDEEKHMSPPAGDAVAAAATQQTRPEPEKSREEGPSQPMAAAHSKIEHQLNDEAVEAAAWRSLFSSLLDTEYKDACEQVLVFVNEHYGPDSLIWLERKGSAFSGIAVTGALRDRPIHINIQPENSRIAEAADRQEPIVLLERRQAEGERPHLKLLVYPVKVGNEVRAAIAVQTPVEDRSPHTSIGRLARAVAPQIEILRLRHEVSKRDIFSRGVSRFTESLRAIDNEDFWMQVARASAELLGAERVSLLVPETESGRLSAKAAIGSQIDINQTVDVGARIARRTLETGQYVVAADLGLAGLEATPPDRKYKTSSFISYPLSIGDRRLAVMNFTDRADGGAFTERDVELLNTIAPQIAVAIDRGELKVRAGELEKRSITDSLTGLLNRGYIEERLVEEMNRASRHFWFPMALLMIDVDNFKSYNDTYGHTAGDVALKLVANVLKETLRAADVAARYGGEEFAVLLPQTGLEEAATIAERIRMRVERTDFPKRRVTISVGIAGYSSEFVEPKDWITAADMALYEAKDHGRNQVRLYEDLGRSFREKIH